MSARSGYANGGIQGQRYLTSVQTHLQPNIHCILGEAASTPVRVVRSTYRGTDTQGTGAHIRSRKSMLYVRMMWKPLQGVATGQPCTSTPMFRAVSGQ